MTQWVGAFTLKKPYHDTPLNDVAVSRWDILYKIFRVKSLGLSISPAVLI